MFQVLSDGKPICEFLFKFSLYDFSHVLDLLRRHSTSGLNWLIMVEHMYSFVKEKYKSILSIVTYIALTIHKYTLVDNTSWIAIHLYMTLDWRHMQLLIGIPKVEKVWLLPMASRL